MSNRNYLENSILLCGTSHGEKFKRQFTIKKVISEGASVVCYEAYHSGSGRGVLKEFYPNNFPGLTRNNQGRLVLPEIEGVQAAFLEKKQAYLDSYKNLLDVKQSDKHPELDSFLPVFEIYDDYNPEKNEMGTVYIWTPEPELTTFQSICDRIHQQPDVRPEYQLVKVLNAVYHLTQCVCQLHKAGFYHRDIKPSNFGFLQRAGKTLTETISLFDINTICGIADKEGLVGPDGYMEPANCCANNQTDIYAIGATLFHAIVITDETKENDYLYKESYYDRLRSLVNNSALIQASEATSHPRLRDTLVTILQNCLCPRSDRYHYCEALLEDLETALGYILPPQVAQKLKNGQRWVLADAEEALDKQADKNTTLTINYHLYQHPLYECANEQAKDLNVLVVGFGNYGQKFLDACLQAGQMWDRQLSVTVLSDEAKDWESYLSSRPSLPDFFNVIGHPTVDNPYGSVTFTKTEINRNSPDEVASQMQTLLSDSEQQPNYIFIALGDDALNRTTAIACSDAAQVLEFSCSVNFACEDAKKTKAPENIHRVCVNEDITASSLHKEIERMAFNTHLVWEKGLNIDRTKVRAEFRKPYNHNSCVASVLALKYKLYSIELDLKTLSLNEAADQFQRACKKNDRNELIWGEHRRWVTEKLCQGWQPLPLEQFAGVTKDERRKQHVCLLRSQPKRELNQPIWTQRDHARWNECTDAELEALDELDRMSVKLHRYYLNQVDHNQNLLQGSQITSIREHLTDCKGAVLAFQEWYACMEEIWLGNSKKVPLYKGLRNAFLNSLQAMPEDKRSKVRQATKAFEEQFQPVLASREYREWKKDDVEFIDNIPFILTYTENVYLAIPYIDDEKEAFDNVAAAAVINPARILYLYQAKKPENLKTLIRSFGHIARLMRKKNLKAAVDFVIAYNTNYVKQIPEDFEKQLRKQGNKKIHTIQFIPYDQQNSLSPLMIEYLTKRAAKKEVFAVQHNDTHLSGVLENAPFAHFEFDSKEYAFKELQGCNLFRYIRKKPHITVADMTAYDLSYSDSGKQPQFYCDHKKLWEIYRKNSFHWKGMCRALKQHAEGHDTLVTFNLLELNSRTEYSYEYLLPFACSKGASKVVDYLKQQKTHPNYPQTVLDEESKVVGHTTDSCKVILKGHSNNATGIKALYDTLFSNFYALMLPDSLSLYTNPYEKTVTVTFDNLQVVRVTLSGTSQPPAQNNGPGNTPINSPMDVLDAFHQLGYLLNLTKTNNTNDTCTVSFSYATNQIKELMTVEGKMLEVHTYHKIKEKGAFDDVVSSYEINWEDTTVKNEFDCLLTKGFRSLFVECKAQAKIDQTYYEKLSALTNKFGINAIPVLVTDTEETPTSKYAQNNAEQRERGNLLGITTVWKKQEIDNIGETLLKIIKGEYES